jgi:hypothetical protein
MVIQNRIPEPGMMTHAYNPSTWKTETGKSKGQPRLHSKFKASLGNIVTPCLKQKPPQQNKKTNQNGIHFLCKISPTTSLLPQFLFLPRLTLPFFQLLRPKP